MLAGARGFFSSLLEGFSTLKSRVPVGLILLNFVVVLLSRVTLLPLAIEAGQEKKSSMQKPEIEAEALIEEGCRRSADSVQPPPWGLDGEQHHVELGTVPMCQSCRPPRKERWHNTSRHKGKAENPNLPTNPRLLCTGPASHPPRPQAAALPERREERVGDLERTLNGRGEREAGESREKGKLLVVYFTP